LQRQRIKKILPVVLLLIPLVFIAILLYNYSMQTVALDGTQTVTVTLTNGNSYLYESAEDVEYYCNLLVDSKQITNPVRDVYNETPITLVYKRGSEEQVYKLYPALNLSGCMIYDSKGRIYLLNESAAQSYLCRAECLYLYDGYMLPQLKVVSGQQVGVANPESYSWNYKKIDGNFYQDRSSSTYDGKVLHAYAGLVNSLEFSIQPDEITEVRLVTEDGELLPLSGIESLSFDDDTRISVSLKAKWRQSESKDFYGEAEYNFTLLYDVPASITLSRESVEAGGVVVIRIDHMNDDDEINFTTGMQTSPIIPYRTSDGTCFALLAVDVHNKADLYDVNFDVGGSVFTAKLLVQEKSGNILPLLESAEDYELMLSDTVLDGVKESFAAVTGGRSAQNSFEFGEKFVPAVTSSSDYYFADQAVLTKGGAVLRLPGNVYDIKYGTAVRAMQRGVVVYARANVTTGNTIIISHGYGIYSYYFNLSAITCEVGTLVTQSQVIGESGNSGYTWTYDAVLQTAISVGGTFVDPTLFYAGMSVPDA